MATITSTQSGDFSDTATWAGGVVPVSGDDAVAATGHIVTIDTDVTVLSFQQAGTGKFVLGGGRTVTGNVIGNAGTYNTGGGTVEVTATVGTTATINGNITGSGSTTQFSCGVNVTGLGAFILNGNITGFSVNLPATFGAPALYTNVNSTITVNGNLTTTPNANLKIALWTDTGSSATLTINGNITGVNGIGNHVVLIGGPANVVVNATTILAGSVHAINIIGTNAVVNMTAVTVSGGTAFGGSGAIGVNSTTATVNVTATIITGGTFTNAYGVQVVNGTVSITAPTVQGGIGANAHGVFASGASTLVFIIGNVFGVGQSGHGVRSDASNANSGVVLTGNMTDSSLGATALFARIFRLNSTPSGITTYTNNVGYPTGGSVTRVSPDNVTGMPAASDVRDALPYGFNSELTGSLAVPPANAVGAGVPVDNTTGTAALSPADIAGLVGAQIAAAVTSP